MTQRTLGGKTVLALGAMAVCYMVAHHAFQPVGFFDRNLDSLGAYVGFLLGALIPWLYLRKRPGDFSGKTAGIMVIAIVFMEPVGHCKCSAGSDRALHQGIPVRA